MDGDERCSSLCFVHYAAACYPLNAACCLLTTEGPSYVA
jgi:hypothetical protein